MTTDQMNMSQEEYRKHEGISRSELNILLNKTPLHFHYVQTHPSEFDSPALVFGRAAHKIILEPESFALEFAVAPDVDRRTKAGRELWNSFCDEHEGREIVSATDYNTLLEMRAAFIAHPIAAKLLVGGLMESSWFWTDAETGEKCKVRPDCINSFEGQKFIIDYKTTDSCADGAFERAVKKYGYKFQAGMYREGMFQNTYEDFKFLFIAQEKTAPYAVRIYNCTEEFINEGYDEFRLALGIYHDCKTKGEWPGYETEFLTEEGGE